MNAEDLRTALSTLYDAEDGSREKDAAYDVLSRAIKSLAESSEN